MSVRMKNGLLILFSRLKTSKVIELVFPVKVTFLGKRYSLLTRICEFGKLLPFWKINIFLREKTIVNISRSWSIISDKLLIIVSLISTLLLSWTFSRSQIVVPFPMLVLRIISLLSVLSFVIPFPFLHLLDFQLFLLEYTFVFTKLLVFTVNILK